MIMENIMLDIETMGNSLNAAVISIAAVYFDENFTGDTFYRKVDLQSSLDAGLTADASTIKWWLQQNDQARSEFIEEGVSLKSALLDLSDFICFGSGEKSKVWGKGPSFDCSILKNAYTKLDIKLPWNFRNERCVRTVLAMFPVDVIKPKVSHNALSDAIAQAEYVSKSLKQKELMLKYFSESL